jgi:hypothetical protein
MLTQLLSVDIRTALLLLCFGNLSAASPKGFGGGGLRGSRVEAPRHNV